MNQPAIKIENLSYSIADKTILKQIFLELNRGDYLSIIGPNGAGKTTLLRCIMRIYNASEGKIWINGRLLSEINQRELAKQVSYVPQSDGRIFPFTVAEFILMGRYPHLSPFTAIQADDKLAVAQALELTQTTHLANRNLNTLSGGEKQTVFIAAALAQGARILLLDEPTTFLDPRHQSDIYRILKKLNRELKMTIISVTHDINQAALQSNRVVILKAGAIVFSGNSSEIMNNQILQPAYQKKFSFLKHPEQDQLFIIPEVS